jgi:PRTRC genetic system ThiF family protein
MNILVIGAGGNGSEVIDGLIKMQHALDIHVTLIDDDIVTPANICRQRYWGHEVGQPKSSTLIHKVNMLCGLSWTAIEGRFPLEQKQIIPNVLISCVDNIQTRKAIGQMYADIETDALWLDMGNGKSNGQVVLGHLGNPKNYPRIDNVIDLYPEILTSIDKPERHSCSTFEALSRQDLFINTKIANAGLNLLWQLVRQRELTVHGLILDLETMTESPIRL